MFLLARFEPKAMCDPMPQRYDTMPERDTIRCSERYAIANPDCLILRSAVGTSSSGKIG
jgi:hypothetical protein